MAYRVVPTKDTNGIVKSVDPDQTAFKVIGSGSTVYTVFLGLSIRKHSKKVVIVNVLNIKY